MRIGMAIVTAAAILALGSVSTAAILTFGARPLAVQTSPSPTISSSLQPSPSIAASPTGQQIPSPKYPPVSIDPGLNFAGGDFVTGTGFNDCKMHVNFVATSKRDGTGAAGTFIMTVVKTANCAGQASGRIACLLVNGNHAVFDGWMDNPTGAFSGGDIMQATVTHNDPQAYGPPVDRAGFGIAGGSPECPPAIAGTGPAIRSGTSSYPRLASGSRRPSSGILVIAPGTIASSGQGGGRDGRCTHNRKAGSRSKEEP